MKEGVGEVEILRRDLGDGRDERQVSESSSARVPGAGESGRTVRFSLAASSISAAFQVDMMVPVS